MHVLVSAFRRTIRVLSAAIVVAASMTHAVADTKSGEADSLVGGTWLAEDIGGNGVIDRAQSTISFLGDGKAAGSGGCNRFTGTAKIDGTSLALGPFATTMMACIPAVMDQDAKFHDALEATRTYRFEGPHLLLIDADGEVLIRLSRRE